MAEFVNSLSHHIDKETALATVIVMGGVILALSILFLYI
jgi:hypothetical protein